MLSFLTYFEDRSSQQASGYHHEQFDHAQFDEATRYEISLFPAEGFAAPEDGQRAQRMQLQPQDGALRVPVCCDDEQEYVIWIERVSGETRSAVGEFRIYALREDLFSRYPFKGDFHMHSNRSDGRECPGYVAGACRRIGLDFMALTDHHRYQPSLEAAKAHANGDDLRIYPGEEVHPPETSVHIVNFGGDHSVNGLFSGDSFARRGSTGGGFLRHPASLSLSVRGLCLVL